nr:MAG TPA: hypothetical protein [Caudoviricetes sp.]
MTLFHISSLFTFTLINQVPIGSLSPYPTLLSFSLVLIQLSTTTISSTPY